MSSYGGFGVPGMGGISSTYENEVLWGGDESKGLALFKSAVYSSTIRDAGNTPTTVIRPGLIVGNITATGKLAEWNADLADGTQDIAGILINEIRATDWDGVAVDRVYRTLVRGPIKAKSLLIEGAAFVGHLHEYQARRQLQGADFLFDDDPFGYKGGSGGRFRSVAVNTTVSANDNGTTFLATAATVFTLPTIMPGLEFDFINTAATNMSVASSEGDNVIVGNDASADSVAFATGGQLIGARLRVKSLYVGTALKWVLETPLPAFGTGTTGALAYALAT